MKKLFIILTILAFCACNSSKKKTETTETPIALETRLAEYMKLTDEMKLEQIMDYIYPKLFDLVPRTKLLESAKEGFDNEEMKVEIDSVKTEKIHPVFEMNKASYARIDYSMIMLMNFKNSIDKDSTGNSGQEKPDTSLNNMMLTIMSDKYGKENVSINNETGLLRIRVNSTMLAIKDEYAKEWSFVNLSKDNEFINKIFSKEVMDKVGTYN